MPHLGLAGGLVMPHLGHTGCVVMPDPSLGLRGLPRTGHSTHVRTVAQGIPCLQWNALGVQDYVRAATLSRGSCPG